MVRYAMSCTAPRAAAALPSGADTNTDCSAAGKAAPRRTAPTAWPAQSSAKPSDSGARCSIVKRDSRGRVDGEAEREEGFGVMKKAKAGRAVRAAQSAHIVAWRGVETAEGGLAVALEQKRRARRLAFLHARSPGQLHRYSKRPVRAISIKRAMRSSVAGCVENRFAMPPPDSGFMIIICAVAGCCSAVGNGMPLA